MKAPRHIAIIMDGNGRWARERGLPRIKGHEAGAEAIREAIEGSVEAGVEFLTLYAFSTENWKRPKAEVAALMHLLEKFLSDRGQELVEKNVRLDAIGRLDDLPAGCRRQLARIMDATKEKRDLTLILALSYSGRAELEDAVRSIAREAKEGRLDPEKIDSEVIRDHLYTRHYPDPDLLIRTSGEMRVSNFLLWQLSYTEIHVTERLWPDFKKTDLLEAIRDFDSRERRYGGL